MRALFILVLFAQCADAQLNKLQVVNTIKAVEPGFVEQINNYRSVNLGVYVQQINDAGVKNKRVWMPYDKKYAQYIDLQKEQADEYIAIQTAGIAEYFRIQNPTSHTGTFTNYETEAGATITTNIGATITITFEGDEISFRYFTQNTGGIWRFVLDGGDQIDISCWHATGESRRTVLFSDLSSGSHTVVGTFIGDDPAHDVATPVGTLYTATQNGQNNGYSTANKTFYIAGSPSPNYCYERNAVITSERATSYSLTQGHFELSWRGTVNYPTDDGEWIPKHGAGASNGAATFTDLTTDRTLKIDGGTNLWLDNTTGFNLAESGDEIILHQIFKGHSWATPGTELAQFDLEMVFTENGIEYNLTMTALVNQLLQANYSQMFGPSPLFDRLLYNRTEEFDISLANVNVTVADVNTWDGEMVMVSKLGSTDIYKSLVAGYKLVDPSTAMNLSVSEGQLLFANDITGSGNKIYPRLLTPSTNITTGRTWSSQCFYNFGFIPDGYNYLK